MRARVRFCLLLTLLGVATFAQDGFAQGETHSSSRSGPVRRSSFSLRAFPKDRCDVFLVTEAAALLRAVNSQKTTDLYHRDGSHRFGEDFGFPVAGQINLGLMFNVSRFKSLGLVAFAAFEEKHSRAGLKVRYRFWEWVGTAIDLEGGLARDMNDDVFSKELNRRQWIIGGLSLSHTQFVHFIFQLESWLQDYPPKRRTSAAYVGLRFGY